jgi:DNA polymerase I-like protein with 3'-5' exonuclease and polymerase domains
MPIVQVDAGQIEWRAAVFLSDDAVGRKELEDGVDMHTVNQALYKLPERVTAKRFLFKLIYGASAYGYSQDPEFTHVSTKEKFWQNVIDKTYEKYPGLYRWHVGLVQTAIATGKIVVPSGREFEFHDAANPRERPKILNYPCQGFSADIMMIARISAYRRLKSLSDVKFVGTIHDSLVLDISAKHLDFVCNTLYTVFDDLAGNVSKMFNIDFNVPLTSEVEYGPNLGDMQEWKRN